MGDGRLLQEAANASYDHLRTFLRWSKPDFTPEDREVHIRNLYVLYLTNQRFEFGIFTPDETRLMGGAAFLLHDRKVEDGVTAIGMWISADDAGKGLGTHVLKQLLHWGFTAWSWQRIEWRCDTLNLASAAVARKAGMQLEATMRDEATPDGTLRDMHVFVLHRADYITNGAA